MLFFFFESHSKAHLFPDYFSLIQKLCSAFGTQTVPTHLTFLTNSNHSAYSKTCFSYKVLQFSFVWDSIFNMTSIATVSASLLPILYVEYDIPSSTNTTMLGLALLKIRCVFILFRQLKPQEVSTSFKHYFVQYLAYVKELPSQNYKAVSKILKSKAYEKQSVLGKVEDRINHISQLAAFSDYDIFPQYYKKNLSISMKYIVNSKVLQELKR